MSRLSYSGKLRLIKHTAQDLVARSASQATYKKKKNIFFTIGIVTIFTIIPSLLWTQALELKSDSSPETSQNLSLLSPNYSVVIPGAIGGPLYNGDRQHGVLVSDIAIVTDASIPQDIKDTNGISIYIVRKGDTLSEIAELFDVSINTIKWENNLGKTLKVGQELRILPITGVMHTIKKGDTFAKIARKYEVEIKDITVFNNIDATKLIPGNKIMIPNGAKHTSYSTTKKSKSSSKKYSSSRTNKRIGGQAQSGYYIRPTAGVVTSPFGPRWGRYHYGIDFAGINGVSPIVAAASGVVEKTYCGRGYGNCLMIRHNNGTKTLYAHTSKILVSKGTKVRQGQKIAILGRTGHATGPHLHFEIIKANGQKMNPNKLFHK